MNELGQNTSVMNRILVTLDTSNRGRAALEAAIRLARPSNAELQGLFVEDEDLLRLAGLPFASEVELPSAASRELQSINMERALRTVAEETQQAFASALQQLNLSWTFRIVRGTVTQASLAAAGDVDLLVIGQQGRSPRAATSEYLPKVTEANGRVVAVFDGSASATLALDWAGKLAKSSNAELAVLVLGRNGEDATQRCLAWLNKQKLRAEVDLIKNPQENAIADFMLKWPPGVLVINRDSEFASDVQIRRFVNDFECPLVLC